MRTALPSTAADVRSSAVVARSPEPDRGWTVRTALRSPRRLRTEVLAGLVVALALIPEAIAFSIVAGVDPRVGMDDDSAAGHGRLSGTLVGAGEGER